MNWEYKLVLMPEDPALLCWRAHAKWMEDTLNAEGADGWELVGNSKPTYGFIFKRPKCAWIFEQPTQ